jgi:hypothetical protein
MPHSIFWLVADALAVARLARLVTSDAIFDRPREYIKRRGTKAALFITCPWCVSVWLAACAVAATHFIPSVWIYACLGLSFSEIAGLLAGHEAS